MREQGFENHPRYILLWHFLLPIAIAVVLTDSVINLFSLTKANLFPASSMIVICLIIMVLWWYARSFALKAQDRAIRAEENFRHYILTGKPFDSRLRMGQIIALRFASDEELPALTTRAIEENLTSKQIKMAIKNWRADYHRV